MASDLGQLARRVRSLARSAVRRPLGLIYRTLPIPPKVRAEVWRTRTSFGPIERRNTRLDSATLKLCCEYAADRFGNRDSYAREIAVYASVHGSWKEGWVPQSCFHDLVVRETTGVPTLSREKTLSNFLLRSNALPDIGYLCGGRFFTRDWNRIAETDLAAILFEGRDRIVFKTNGSLRGRGVSVLTRATLDTAAILALGDGCFQSFIQPSQLVPFHDMQAVPTLRLITTMTPGGGPVPRFAGLRVARATQTHVESDDAVRIPVDLVTGALRQTGYLADWTRIDRHPDTNVTFAGLSFPQLQDGVSLCVDLHARVPCFISIGWDICLDSSGRYQIMEWNQLHNISFTEAVNGPSFVDLDVGLRSAPRVA